MKPKPSLLLLISLWCAILASAQEIRVATYNIRLDTPVDAVAGNGWARRAPVVCQLVRFHDFDIFGAQEVLHNQLRDMLSGLPGYDYIGVGRDDGKTQGEYSPIFYKQSRFELLDSGVFWLSEQTDRPNKGWDAALPRICTWGKFRDRESSDVFWFFNTHFDHIGKQARAESSRLILRKVNELAGKGTVILTGDFNVDQFNESYVLIINSGILSDSYDLAEKRYALNGTFNGFDLRSRTESRIDHIFVSKPFRVLNYGILTDIYWSDDSDGDAVPLNNAPGEISARRYTPRLPSDHFPVAVQLTRLR